MKVRSDVQMYNGYAEWSPSGQRFCLVNTDREFADWNKKLLQKADEERRKLIAAENNELEKMWKLSL